MATTTDWRRFEGAGPFFRLKDGQLQVAAARAVNPDSHVWYPDLATAGDVPLHMGPEAVRAITDALMAQHRADALGDHQLDAMTEYDIEREMRR